MQRPLGACVTSMHVPQAMVYCGYVLGHIAVTPTYQIIRFNNVTDLGYHVHS